MMFEESGLIGGIGIDLVEVDRMRRIVQRYDGFLTRIFRAEEIEYCQKKRNPFPHFAVRFAAKEAVFKALGSGWSMGLRWKEVAVEKDAANKPWIRLRGGTKRLAERRGVKNIHVSLTHTGNYAIAQILMES